MIILLNTVKTIGHGIFKITNRAVKLILLRRISFAIHQHNQKEEKHSSTARQLFCPRLISSVTRNNWRENANPESKFVSQCSAILEELESFRVLRGIRVIFPKILDSI